VLLAACLVAAVVAAAPAAGANTPALNEVGVGSAGPPAYGLHRDGELIVAFRPNPAHDYSAPGSPAAQANADVHAAVKRDFTPYGLEGVQVVTLPPGLSVEKAIAIYESNPNVRYAEPNFLRELMAAPNDLYFSRQWPLLNTVSPSSDIDAVQAWDVTTGSSSVVVAVVDTGIAYTHPDLAANIWSNADEVPGDGVDNDNNLYVDDVRGWDFAGNDNDPIDVYYHGTHCSGIIGAAGNNGVGISGVMQQVRLMPVRVFDDGNYLVDSEHLVAAWLYAGDNGARVISCSFGGGPYTYSELEQEAIQATDALFVFAAGNTATDNDLLPTYPASYPLANIIAVAATDSSDRLASFSSYGLSSVDLAAPGVNVYSTGLSGSYRYASGTSMAAPHVAGVAGLVLSQEPGLSVGELKARILNGVEPVPALQGKVATGGRLNAYGALIGNPNVLAAAFTASPTSGTAPLAVQFADTSTGAPGSWAWDFGDGTTSTLQNPTHIYADPGSYTVTLTATDAAGLSDTATMTGMITVTASTDFEAALEAPALTWDTDAGAPWTVDMTVTHDGQDSARSGPIGNSASSRLSATVTGPATVSFWWKVSSEYISSSVWDGLVFTVDHSAKAVIAGEADWTQYQYTLPAGEHSLVWTYQKNSAGSTGSDASWLDQVTVIGPAPTVSSITPGTGTQGTPVVVTDLAGTRFASGASVALRRAGSTDILASDVAVISPTKITCLFNIPATAATGAWDVVVTNPDGQSVTLAGGFTINPAPPVAAFSAAPTSGKAPLDIAFTDQSTGATGWSWDFGDSGTSTLQDPSHTYNTAGTYTVRLTASNTAGQDVEEKTAHITVLPKTPPIASFIPTSSEGKTPLAVQFADTSTGGTPTSWSWTFGDGGTSTEQNPSHTYKTAGTYPVTLTATNDDGSSTASVENCVRAIALTPPVAAFTQDVTSGKVPLTVQFTDQSTNTPNEWAWDFENDGTVDSTQQSPSHIYTGAGTYAVSLTASNNDGPGTVTKTNLITVQPLEPPTADFSATPTSGKVSLTVQFTDLSAGATGWSWDFGDNTPLSTDRNPSHTYDKAGTYAVTLTATNADGSDVEAKAGYVTVSPLVPPVAAFTADVIEGTVPFAVTFTDQSTNDPTTWSWDFGDGGTSTLQNPSHEYTTPGTFTVRLTATNTDGHDIEEKVGYITARPPVPAPVASFTQTPSSGLAPLAVTFMDQSTNSPTSWSWDFGDGSTSTEQSPSHTYSAFGVYTVSLTATNAGGSNTSTVEGAVTVVKAANQPVAAFTWAVPAVAGSPVQFTDQSMPALGGTIASWAWNFGDGTSSTVRNPVHTFAAPGDYATTLRVKQGKVWSLVLQKTVHVQPAGPPPPPPAADFSAMPTSGTAPLAVQFTDRSTGGATSWRWDFGDGGTSTVQSPSHTYAAAGTFTVTLTTTNAGGSDAEVKTGYITVQPPPLAADFSGSPTSGKVPLNVQFTDRSSGGATGWSWDFNNDGTTDSTVQNPSYRYQVAGTYTVRLTVRDASGGSASTTKTNYITVRTRK
jgi:PKD repeat protein